MRLEATAIFDIGKTNKKFFLFDNNLNEVYSTYHRLPYSRDDDGFSCESLENLTSWIHSTFEKARQDKRFHIRRLNFTSYGASLVHLNKEGEPVTPLYNYLKPYPEALLSSFLKQYGPQKNFFTTTASPKLGMLNAGLHLYWLKYTKPEIFNSIHTTLHLPQYLSYRFTGVQTSEFTSVGCHTAMWDFQKSAYHGWLQKEGITRVLPKVKASDRHFDGSAQLEGITIGTGVHDSSAALLPYLLLEDDPFVLLSTGTWGISINPFNSSPLNVNELQEDCLHYLSVSGQPVKASRLFIGEEHKYQIDKMYAHFNLPRGTYKKLIFNEELFDRVRTGRKPAFSFRYIDASQFGIESADKTDLSRFNTFEESYYTFLHELTDLQLHSLKLIMTPDIVKVYIDGGFSANGIFTNMLQKKLTPVKVLTSDFALGTALGAAILIQDHPTKNVMEAKLAAQIEFRRP